MKKKVQIVEIWIPPKTVKSIGGKDKWVHLAITTDVKAGKTTFYVDGKLTNTLKD